MLSVCKSMLHKWWCSLSEREFLTLRSVDCTHTHTHTHIHPAEMFRSHVVQIYLRSVPLGVASGGLKIFYRGKKSTHQSLCLCFAYYSLNVINGSNDRRDKQQNFRRQVVAERCCLNHISFLKISIRCVSHICFTAQLTKQMCVISQAELPADQSLKLYLNSTFQTN